MQSEQTHVITVDVHRLRGNNRFQRDRSVNLRNILYRVGFVAIVVLFGRFDIRQLLAGEKLVEEAFHGYLNNIERVQRGQCRLQIHNDASLGTQRTTEIFFAFDEPQRAIRFERLGDSDSLIATGGKYLAVGDHQYSLLETRGNAVIREQRGANVHTTIAPWHVLTLGLGDTLFSNEVIHPRELMHRFRDRITEAVAADVVGSTIQIRWFNSRHNFQEELWFDRVQGYGCLKARVVDAEGMPVIDVDTNWVQFDDVWLPVASRSIRPGMEPAIVVATWESVNEELEHATFSIDELIGDDSKPMYSQELGEKIYIGSVGRLAEAVGIPPLSDPVYGASTRSLRIVLILALGFGGFAACTVFWIVNRGKAKPSS